MKGNQILYVVLAVTIILLIAIAYDSRRPVSTEGFENGCPILPMKSTTIYKKNGKKSCCYSTVNGERCAEPEHNECIIGSAYGGISECGEFARKLRESSLSICPKSMQTIFFTESAVGCTDGPLNQSESGPLHTSSKQCTMPVTRDSTGKLVPSTDSAKTDPNNCLNVLERESLECIGSDCDTFIRKSQKGVLVGMDFTTNDGMRHSCYAPESYRRMLETAGIASTAIDTILQTHPSVCSVAKRLYVDRSMSPADVKLLP